MLQAAGDGEVGEDFELELAGEGGQVFYGCWLRECVLASLEVVVNCKSASILRTSQPVQQHPGKF